MEQKALERLEAKSVEEAIINQISRDFNLAPFMARTHFHQLQSYFERYLGRAQEIGQMSFLAVRADSPPGQPVAAGDDPADPGQPGRSDRLPARAGRVAPE